MSPARGPLWKALRRSLTAEAGGETRTAAQMLVVARRRHESLIQHLAPIIGEAALDALVSQTLRKAKTDFPGLRDIERLGPGPEAMSEACEHFKKHKITELEEIIVALMVFFVNLLSTFIGKGLTWKLMRRAWPEGLPSEFPAVET